MTYDIGGKKMEYIKRFVEEDFKEWKERYSRFTLEVVGCRQVGKTTTVLHFAKENYDTVISINVGADTNIFLLEQANEHNVVDALSEYCRRNGITFVNDRRTVLVMDEIQESKMLYERIRIFNRCLECDVIVTGSYLQKARSYFQPMGDIMKIEMFPLSYEEYLEYFGLYKPYKTSSTEQLCDKYLNEFKAVYELYLHVGGYPSVFISYLEKNSIDKNFENLIDIIFAEFKNNADRGADFDKIDQMFRAACKFLCNEKKGNRRVVETISKLTEQDKSKRISSKECNNLLAWMVEAHIINYCGRYDLRTEEFYPSERFYFEDVGLFNYLCKMYGIRQATIDGILAETFVFKSLAEKNFSERFYEERPAFATDADYELDFCVRSKIDDKLYGIEVKSGNGQGVSANKMLEDRKIDYVVFAKGTGSVGEVGEKYTIPIFFFNKFTFDKGGVVERRELPRIDKDTFKYLDAF